MGVGIDEDEALAEATVSGATGRVVGTGGG